jgi:hypothetical protein
MNSGGWATDLETSMVSSSKVIRSDRVLFGTVFQAKNLPRNSFPSIKIYGGMPEKDPRSCGDKVSVWIELLLTI